VTDAYGHAGSLAAVGRYEDAERELRSGLAASPADAHLLTLLGYVLRMRRDYPSALRTSEAAIEAAPDLAAAHAERAENLIALIRSAEAVGAATEAARLDPYDPAGHLVLARALASCREHDRARAAAKRGLTLDPGSVEALLTVADVERDAGHHDAAMAAARGALAKDPASGYGRWLVAMLDAEKLHVGRSMRALREVARDNPARPDVISMTWPVRSLLSALRRWLAAAAGLVVLGALLTVWWDTAGPVARTLAGLFAFVVLGFGARVLVPAGRLPWRCLRLVPRLLRRGIIGGLAALGVVLGALIGYAATGHGLLAVLALVAVPVMWVCGFLELLGARLDDPGFGYAVKDLGRQFAEFGGELREWWHTTKRDLREAWNEPDSDRPGPR
jgi:tetratricopeptide (TPR) repeat protein